MKRTLLPVDITPVRALRLVRNLSQTECARRAEISQSHWGAIERGESVPSIDIAKRVASALGATVEELWPDSGARKAS